MVELNKTQQINDIIHSTIPYSGLEGAIISTPIFNRLHRILQSSLVYLTFSSNKVKRFEHSIGTMHLSGEIFYNSVVNTTTGTIDRLLLEAEEELKKWFKAIDVSSEKMLSNDIVDQFDNNILKVNVPNCSLYRTHSPQNVNSEHDFAYYVLFQSIRVAGLLHDAGHLPYSHVFEHAAQSLYEKTKNVAKPNKAQEKFLEIMKPYCECDNELHEEIGNALLKQIKLEISEELSQNISQDNIFVLAVFHFVEKILKSSPSNNDLFSDMHSIVSGILDSDRLDYCSRDAFCSGMRKDVISYQRLFSNYKIISQSLPADMQDNEKRVPVRERIMFCPALKNVTDIEDLLERRWKIFSQINYHHRVHKHEILFAEVLSYVGFKELESKDEGITPIQNGTPLPLELSSIWCLVDYLSENNRLIDYLIIQLDDSWMDTLLKISFFKEYHENYRNAQTNSHDYMWSMFDELISSKKHYYSYFKRSMDFISFESAFKTKWLGLSLHFGRKTGMKKMYALVTANITSKKSNNPGYAFNTVINAFVHKGIKNRFYQNVEKSVNEYLSSKKGQKLNIIHCMIRPCDFSLGCYSRGSPLYLWDKDEKARSFEMVSICEELLTQQKTSYVPFHLYFLPSHTQEYTHMPNYSALEKIVLDAFIDELKKIR